jgi:hypothetical protein
MSRPEIFSGTTSIHNFVSILYMKKISVQLCIRIRTDKRDWVMRRIIFSRMFSTFFDALLMNKSKSKFLLASMQELTNFESLLETLQRLDQLSSGIRLSYRPARLHRLAGRYDNPMPESTLSPSSDMLLKDIVQPKKRGV